MENKIDMEGSSIPCPVTHQDLFFFAINQRIRVIGEFHNYKESLKLRMWATWYAALWGLNMPTVMLDERPLEIWGIYFEPDEEDLAEWRAEGLYE